MYLPKEVLVRVEYHGQVWFLTTSPEQIYPVNNVPSTFPATLVPETNLNAPVSFLGPYRGIVE